MSALNQERQTRPTLAESPAVLRELVQRYRVCWDVWPAYLSLEEMKQRLRGLGASDRGWSRPKEARP